MRKLFRAFAVMFAGILLLFSGCEQKEKVLAVSGKPEHQEIIGKLDDYLQQYEDIYGLEGALLVAHGDDILVSRGFGMADYEKSVPITPTTTFMLGSLTKQFTAAAILMLQKEGKLSVQDTLDKYLPDYPDGGNIKLYHLLTHTSGIPELLQLLPESMEQAPQSPEELIALFLHEPLLFESGSEYQYSNSNYVLLAYVIEKASGEKYEAFLKKSIFAPLGMTNTGFIGERGGAQQDAVGYDQIDMQAGTYTRTAQWPATLAYGAGDIYSTAEDLLKWNQSFISGELLSKEAIEEMTTASLSNYGYGVMIASSVSGTKIISHGGSIPGFQTYMTRDAEKGYIVIALSNLNRDRNPASLAPALLQILEEQ